MKNSLLCAFICLLLTPAIYAATPDTNLNLSIQQLQQRWAKIKYQQHSEKQQVALFKQLASDARQLASSNPDSAGALIWEGIILSTTAGVKGGLGALSLIKEAKVAFEQSLILDSTAMMGSAYTSLGSLYYQVPGWPIGFGSDKKALQFLKKGLKINPEGIDSNYFYGDFLIHEGRYHEALEVLERALQAAPREGRALADEGRKNEIKIALKIAKSEIDN